MADRLANRQGIVTGAGSGIGRAIAHRLVSEGASLVLVDMDGDGLEETCAGLRKAPGFCRPLTGDVSDPAVCHKAVEWALQRAPTLHIVVNNAGIIHRGSILETEPEVWDRLMAVNLRSVFLMSRAALPHMSAGATIINIASGWGLSGGQRAAAYCASKGGVVQLTRAMALDHGAQGIRVNCVCPGDTDTPLLRQEARELGQDWDSFLRDAARRPLARVGTPGDVANACLFLASEESSFVTGSVLVVDGGGLAGNMA